MIKEKLKVLAQRVNPPIYTDITVVERRKEKRRYMICDYCGERIYLNKSRSKMNGGIVELSYVITKNDTCLVVLCNKCVVPALNEF